MITPNEPYPALAKAIGVTELYFKREDLHPYGSHKGRSIPAMIDLYILDGDKRFAISSSGNAALAAALHIKALNWRAELQKKDLNEFVEPIGLDIFVTNNINPRKLEKLKAIEDANIRILIKERPLQALTVATSEGARSLRQSTDDNALIGYEELAKELTEIKNLGAVFIGTSSGTTAQSLAQYFDKNQLPVQIHIIQTSSCHPIADTLDTFDTPDEESTADAIIDHLAYRKNNLTPLIINSGGKAWCATNDNIKTAQELVKKHSKIEISTNSALSVVGAMQTAYEGYETNGAVVCIICGD